MKIWVDDVRPAPEGYEWFLSVDMAINYIQCVGDYRDRWGNMRSSIQHFIIDESDREELLQACNRGVEENTIELIDLDHDAGDYASDGGDYVKLLDWLEETGRNYPIRLHTMNPVGRENMRAIIQRNGWTEIQ